MYARDVMTKTVVSVNVTIDVREVARLFLSNRISGAPVTDDDGRLVGMVTEGDIMRRADAGTARRRGSWWRELLANPSDRASAYVKEHALRVGDVMSEAVICADEDTPLDAIADLLEENRVKRVPVIHDDRVVGIVSRADLLRVVAAALKPAVPHLDDSQARDRIVAEFDKAGVDSAFVGIAVADGIAHLWGQAHTIAEKTAARVAAEEIVGPAYVDDKISVMPADLEAEMWVI